MTGMMTTVTALRACSPGCASTLAACTTSRWELASVARTRLAWLAHRRPEHWLRGSSARWTVRQTPASTWATRTSGAAVAWA